MKRPSYSRKLTSRIGFELTGPCSDMGPVNYLVRKNLEFYFSKYSTPLTSAASPQNFLTGWRPPSLNYVREGGRQPESFSDSAAPERDI